MSISLNESTLSPSYQGLSTADAEVKMKECGKNARASHRKKNDFQRIFGIITEPMVGILIGTTVIYYFIGSHVETLIFALSIIPVVAIQYFQEKRTDKAIELLDSMLVEECQVYRDGALVKLPSTEIVPGDLVYLTAGDRIPADGVISKSVGILVDEAVLTGESIPVIKSPYEKNAAGIELFQGTMVVQGEGLMVITATGGSTKYGKLGNLLEGIEDEQTPLQRQLKSLIKQLAIGAIFISLFIGIVLGQQQGLIKGILGTLTIAMSIIPEEFPIVFSVFLIMGVWRLSKRKALVRKMVMVETLGSVTTICSDKTGTLTEGSMSLEKVYFNGKLYDVNNLEESKSIAPLIETAILAMEKIAIDPMEVEMQRFAREKNIIYDDLYSDFKLVKDSSFNAQTKTVSHIWEGADKVCHQYSAGAPESIVEFCKWKGDEKKDVVEVYEKLASEGYRVVGIAKAKAGDCTNFLNKNLSFVGLIAMSDPPREGVKEAIEVCKGAGIRVVMITGDHSLTATAIAKKIGLEPGGDVVEGKDLDGMCQDKIYEMIKERNIFARIRPEQKYLLVEALQANEQIVAMTGDGVNDAPALKRATIGIAMGIKGTAVARAASGIVLIDDNFTTIVKAVEEGRRIYDNLRKAFLFLFSFHLPIIGLAIIPLLLGQDLYFLPIHVIFLEFISDPTTVIGLERDPVDPKAMQQPPRPVNDSFLDRKLWWRIGWTAAGILGVTLWFYGYGLWNGNITIGRTMSFLALVISQIILVLVSRNKVQVKENSVLSMLLILIAASIHLIIFVPYLRDLFHFASLNLFQYIYTISLTIIVSLFFNLIAKKN